jgi:NAD(P)-dependent dehydrogenase (short-subunit alcohol dehydrogenase family)
MSEQFPLPYNNSDLKGQVAFVTGAASGLGRRFSKVLAAAGASVAVAARRFDRLESLVAEITADGGTAVAVQLDVTDASQITAAIDSAEKALGPITILINNAGIPDAQFATRMSVELIDQVLDTNVRGPFLLSTEIARRLIDRKSAGRMINISSVSASHYDGHGAALYSVSKAAIDRMTKTLAVEWARFNINVNAIAPGAFHSEMMDGMLERVGDISKGFPRKRLGDPAQLDSTLLYLCAPASEFVTGTIITVDDGQTPR